MLHHNGFFKKRTFFICTAVSKKKIHYYFNFSKTYFIFCRLQKLFGYYWSDIDRRVFFTLLFKYSLWRSTSFMIAEFVSMIFRNNSSSALYTFHWFLLAIKMICSEWIVVITGNTLLSLKTKALLMENFWLLLTDFKNELTLSHTP